MANKKIDDLTPVTTQRSTDEYEMSNAGTGSFKETRQQMIDYVSAALPVIPAAQGGTGVDNGDKTLAFNADLDFIGGPATLRYPATTDVIFPASGTLATLADIPVTPPQTLIVRVDSAVGSDLTGDGDSIPYATISHALTQITDASFIKPYLISASGAFNDADWVLKPNVSYDFNGGRYFVSGGISASSAFLGVNSYVSVKNVFVNFASGVLLDLTVNKPNYGCFVFDNWISELSFGLTINSSPDKIIDVYVTNLTPGLGAISFAQRDCSGGAVGCEFANLAFFHTSDTVGTDFSISATSVSDTLSITDDSTGVFDVHLTGSYFESSNLTAQNTGLLRVKSTGCKYATSLNLSGAGVQFDADVLQLTPVLLSGAAYSPTSHSQTVKANIPAPSNYTPSDSSVGGHLMGIDAGFNAYFKAANNLAELNVAPGASQTQTRANLGLPTGTTLYTNANVVSGEITLTNPVARNIALNVATVGVVLKLPPVGVFGGLANGEYLVLRNYPTAQDIIVADASANVIATVPSAETWVAEYVGTLAGPTGWLLKRTDDSGSGGSISLQDAYDGGGTIDMTESAPILVSAGATAPGQGAGMYPGGLHYAYAPWPQTRVLGVSFTAKVSGIVTQFGYAKDYFTGSPTRTIALYAYGTSVSGTLVAIATVTNPSVLDPTGNFYMVNLAAPVGITQGVRYVLAVLTPNSDSFLYYQDSEFGNYFADVDGNAYPGAISGVMIYPPITNVIPGAGGPFGNANLNFQAISGYQSTFSVSPKSISEVFFQVYGKDQVSMPFNSGGSSDLAAINIAGMPDGAVYHDDTKQALMQYNNILDAWYSLGLGKKIESTSSRILISGIQIINYFSGLTTYTMPAQCKVGESIKVIGYSAGGWKINLNSGQSVYVNGNNYLVSMQSTRRSDTITLTCVIENTEFVAEPVGAIAFT